MDTRRLLGTLIVSHFQPPPPKKKTTNKKTPPNPTKTKKTPSKKSETKQKPQTSFYLYKFSSSLYCPKSWGIKRGITELLRHHELTPAGAGDQCPPLGHLSQPVTAQSSTWTCVPIFCKASPKPSDLLRRNKYQMIKPLTTHIHGPV